MLHHKKGDRKGVFRGSKMPLYPSKGHTNAATTNARYVWHQSDGYASIQTNIRRHISMPERVQSLPEKTFIPSTKTRRSTTYHDMTIQ